MADEASRIDVNQKHCLMGVTNAVTPELRNLKVDPTTGRLLVSAIIGGSTGTVTSVSVTTANGISGTVATATTTPAITLTLGAITPTSVNGLTITANGTNTLNIAAGKTLVISNNLTFSGTDGSTLAIGTGGTLGTGAYATIANYAPVGQTFYIGTTQVAINRASAALTLAGITLTSPTFDTSATGSYLTASEILVTDADKKIVSAPVATYPSLTELTYVKGVTSAIQTQIGNKSNSASPTFTGTVTLADNCRIDLTLPTTDGYCTGPTTDSFASGYSSAVGDLVFFGTGGKWLECDADAIATAGTLLGIALEAKTDGQAMKVALPGSMVRIDAWNWNVGKCLYASETLGAISESIPTGADGVVKVVGVSLSSDAIYFYPSQDHSTTVA